MGFIPYAYGTGASDAYEYHAISDMAAKLGMAMNMSAGLLVAATGATKPTYICMTENNNTEEGDTVAVIRVKESTRFVGTLSQDADTLEVGDKLQLSADGTKVTAVTGGCFEVVEIRGTEIDDEVIGRFVEADEVVDDEVVEDDEGGAA